MKNKRYLTALLLTFPAVAGMCDAARCADAPLRPVADSTVTSGVAARGVRMQHAGEQLVVTFDLVLDSVDVPSNQRYVYTPALRGRGEERLMGQVVVNGRKQQVMYERADHRRYPEATVAVRRESHEPQRVTYTATLPYEPWMENADLALYEDLCGCGDLLERARTVVGRRRAPKLAFIRPEARPKSYNLSGSAYLDFPVDRTELHPDYRNNPAELQKIINTINVVKEDPNASITAIDIHGYASPESPWDHNAMLAEGRAATLKDYVSRLMQLNPALFTVSTTPEDWAGLRRRVETSTLTHRDEILAIIDDARYEPDAREWKIKSTYPEEYGYMLREWYPALRHSDYTVTYTVRPFSVEEAKALLHTKPQQLSQEEMYQVAQTYAPGSREFNEVFEVAVRMFPNDTTANLNAACAALSEGDTEAAKRYLAKAGRSPYALNAMGVIAMREGREAEARALFGQAAAAGLQEAKDNLRLFEDME